MQQQTSVKERLKRILKESLPKAYATSKWLLSIILPVSLGVMILNYTGVLRLASYYLAPAFELIGLPGESAFVLLTSIFTSIYSVIAIIIGMELEGRVVTILSVMCLIAHGFVIETAVLKKTGSSATRMILLRLLASLAMGAFLNLVLPADTSQSTPLLPMQSESFSILLTSWLVSSLRVTVKIIIVITLLMIFQKILDEFNIIKWLIQVLLPFQKLMGLPSSTSFSWIVANTLGLSYGSAIIMEQVEEGKMSKPDADLLNHHIAISHSQFVEPFLFAAIGAPLFWMVVPRLLLGIVVVWMCRFEMYVKAKFAVRKDSLRIR